MQRNVDRTYRSVCALGGPRIVVVILRHTLLYSTWTYGCTLLCNLTLSSCNDRDMCVCVFLHSTQVAGRTNHMQSCVNVCLHVCVAVGDCQGVRNS